ncbi:MAG: site-specific integrase, partial [Bryobacteraceae bacterium]
MRALASQSNGVSGPVRSFLDFCRVEKGLSTNSFQSYLLDLKRFISELPVPEREASAEHLSSYVESLYRAGLSARSIARHITTLRNFYRFLAREGEIDRDPTEFLDAPRQWSTLPKYLNKEQIERLLAVPPVDKPKGLRDRAMIELLYATG